VAVCQASSSTVTVYENTRTLRVLAAFKLSSYKTPSYQLYKKLRVFQINETGHKV